MIGHNQASFDQIVEENLQRGLYLVQLQALQRCIKDPRLDQRHRLVLVALSECTNVKTGMAYPGYAWLAANIVYYVSGEERRYSEGTIRNTLSELAALAYLTMSRRAPSAGRRALAHYAITPPSLEELQAEIAKACAAIRAMPKRTFPVRPDVNSSVDVMARVDVKAGDDIGPTDVNLSPADVNTSVAQELVEGTGKKNTENPQSSFALESPADAGSSRNESDFDEFWSAFPQGRKRGKGVTLQIFRKVVSGKHRVGRATPQMLITAARDYAATRPDPKYVPLPTTWLNQGRWMDEVGKPKARAAPAGPSNSSYDDELAAVRASIAEMHEEQP